MSSQNCMPSARIRLRCAVYIEQDGEVLLVHDPVYRGGCWILPGGGVEAEETIVEAAEREVKEETGLIVKVHSLWRMREIWEQETDFPDQLDSERRSLELIFIADYVSGKINITEDPSKKPDGIRRVKECRWFSIKNLGPTIEKVPIYPEVLFDSQRPEDSGIDLGQLLLERIDLRGER